MVIGQIINTQFDSTKELPQNPKDSEEEVLTGILNFLIKKVHIEYQFVRV